MSFQEKISWGVTLSILRRQGVDIASMPEEQLNALVRERKAEKQAEAAAREARRAQRQQVMPDAPSTGSKLNRLACHCRGILVLTGVVMMANMRLIDHAHKVRN